MLPIHCNMNATRDANTEEHMITLETGKANPVPASNCPVGAISESCATMLVTQNKPTNITAIKISAVNLPKGAISTDYNILMLLKKLPNRIKRLLLVGD